MLHQVIHFHTNIQIAFPFHRFSRRDVLPQINISTNYTTAINSTIPVNLPPNENEMSWQSAFWALIVLSLNAMNQRSVDDHSPSSDLLSPARSSSFVYLVELVVMVCWLIKGKSLGMDIRTEIRCYRKDMGLIREAGNRELIQGIPAVTIAFLALGPFPQALEVFGMSGLRGQRLGPQSYSPHS